MSHHLTQSTTLCPLFCLQYYHIDFLFFFFSFFSSKNRFFACGRYTAFPPTFMLIMITLNFFIFLFFYFFRTFACGRCTAFPPTFMRAFCSGCPLSNCPRLRARTRRFFFFFFSFLLWLRTRFLQRLPPIQLCPRTRRFFFFFFVSVIP